MVVLSSLLSLLPFTWSPVLVALRLFTLTLSVYCGLLLSTLNFYRLGWSSPVYGGVFLFTVALSRVRCINQYVWIKIVFLFLQYKSN